MKSIDIFIKTYKKDFKLLSYSLQSITKNVTGYKNIIILIPENEKHLFDTRNLPERTLIHYVNDWSRTQREGYLLQQVFKLKAYNYSSAKFILFSDSDMIFDHAINIQDFIADGKPEILCTKWDKVGDAVCWKIPTEEFIKEPVSHERMRRNGLIYHRDTLVNIDLYAPDLEKTIMSSEKFSEFNVMSAYAFKYEFDKYNFIDTDNWNYTEPKGVQLWGWAEKDNANEPHPYEYARSLEIINKTLALNLTSL